MLKTSDYFILSAAIISMALSIILWFTIDRESGVFVGLWVPSILGFGAYFKLLNRRN
jgi:hypothetical protein